MVMSCILVDFFIIVGFLRVKNTNLKEISNFRKIYFSGFLIRFENQQSDNYSIFSKNGSKLNLVFLFFAKMWICSFEIELVRLFQSRSKYLIFSNIYPFFDENLEGS